MTPAKASFLSAARARVRAFAGLLVLTGAALGQSGALQAPEDGDAVETTRRLQRIARGNPGVWRLEVKRGGRVLRIALRG